MRRLKIAAALALVAALPLLMAPSGNAPIPTPTATANVGTVGVCTVTLNQVGVLKFVRVGNLVTAYWSTQLNCSTAAVSIISFTSVIPTGFVPAVTQSCMQDETTSIGTGFLAHILFTSAAGISIAVAGGGATQTSWFGAGGACTYSIV
jgi:hypothetical protein